MSRRRKYLCGVPERNCTGGYVEHDMAVSHHAHSTPEEAFNCKARYMIRVQGYTQIGPREFCIGNGPIEVLTKKSRFGGEMRSGKSKDGQSSRRMMPKARGAGTIV